MKKLEETYSLVNVLDEEKLKKYNEERCLIAEEFNLKYILVLKENAKENKVFFLISKKKSYFFRLFIIFI